MPPIILAGIFIFVVAAIWMVILISRRGYRCRILQEVYSFLNKGPNNFVFADTLKCFSRGDQKFLNELKQLIAERLLLTMQGSQNRLAVAINPDKMQDVRQSFWWRQPEFIIPTAIGILGLMLAFIGLLTKA